jgi:hypothetical protein
MLTKWKLDRWGEIERVECTKETDKSVWVLERQWSFGSITKPPIERKRAKVSDSTTFHDTWEDAHKTMLERAKRKLDAARVALQRAQDEYGNVKGMRNPEECTRKEQP